MWSISVKKATTKSLHFHDLGAVAKIALVYKVVVQYCVDIPINVLGLQT